MRPIEELFRRQAHLLELTVGGRTILTTAEHPFYVVGGGDGSAGQDKGWVPAGDLAAGDLLLCANGRALPVESLRLTDRFETVYNFRVAQHHTYFVGELDAWGWALWAHNARYQGAELQKAGDPQEILTSQKTGIPRNIGNGRDYVTNRNGLKFYPDSKIYGPNGSLALRRSLLESKGGDHVRLSGHDRRQIRGLIAGAEMEAGKLGYQPIVEIVTKYKPTRPSGTFFKLQESGVLKFLTFEEL